MEVTKYHKAIILAVLVVAFIAFMDVQGIKLYDQKTYTDGNQGPEFIKFFYNWAYALILLVPITYYLFYRKDKSEALAIGLVSFILLFTGFADILFFWFQKLPVAETLPWLIKHPVIGRIANIMGQETVTRGSLYISVVLGIIASYFTQKKLKEIN